MKNYLRMRLCVQLRVVKDSSYQEIASIMGLSINTVKAHLFKARESLKDKLNLYFGLQPLRFPPGLRPATTCRQTQTRTGTSITARCSWLMIPLRVPS